jgi:PAS domain S-box-containing protein
MNDAARSNRLQPAPGDAHAPAAAEALAGHQLRLLREIAANYPLATVLDDLCATLEAASRRPLRTTVMLREGERLRCVAAPGLPPAFRTDRNATGLDDSGTACAEAVRSGRRVVVADTARDDVSAEIAACRENWGFGAVWSYPVVREGEAIGTLALMPNGPGEPDAEDERLVEFALEIVRLALAREHDARALRESEQRFRDYAELSADWFWEQDAEFRFTEVRYGSGSRPAAPPHYDRDSIGKQRWELPYIDVPEHFWEEHRRLLAAGQPFSGLRLRRLGGQGEVRHVELAGKPLFDEAGRLAGYRGTGRDITGQVAAREEIEKTRLWLEQAIRAGNIGLWERDIDTWEFRLPANWKALFGYAEDEIGNGAEDFDRLVHPDDLQRIHAAARVYADNPRGEYENRFRVRHKDGGWRWVLSRGQVLADPAGGRRTWMGCHIDITPQMHAEEALRAKETLLAKVLELLPVGVWFLDGEGNITRTNEAGRRIWGGEHLVGMDRAGDYKGLRLDSGKRIEPKEWAGVRALLYGETTTDEELEIECFDGSRKIVLNSAMPLRGDEGNIMGAVFMNHDITARWHAERQLRELNETLEARVSTRTAALEEANRELDAFNFSVSHDLRTPLRAIDGFSRILLEDYPERLDAAGRDYLLRIGDAAARMGELIAALHDLTRLGRAELHLRPVDLSALAHELTAELRREAPQREVRVDIAETPPAEGDARLLRAALANLLDNAWKYTAKRAPARIAFGARTNDAGRTVYFVRDNGAGFDMQFADKLFRLFQRLHREEEFGGRGVGLVSAERIVRRHGGRIWAEAGKDRGATFFFTLGDAPVLHGEAAQGLMA